MILFLFSGLPSFINQPSRIILWSQHRFFRHCTAPAQRQRHMVWSNQPLPAISNYGGIWQLDSLYFWPWRYFWRLCCSHFGLQIWSEKSFVDASCSRYHILDTNSFSSKYSYDANWKISSWILCSRIFTIYTSEQSFNH